MSDGLISTIIEKLLSVFKGKTPTDLKMLQEVYKTTIIDLKIELEEQKAIIRDYKKKHPENGEELAAWERREEELHRSLIDLVVENRNLREELIFLKKGKN